MAKTLEITIECKSCKATGIYQGFAEREGCAVVCAMCEGTGAQTLSGTAFTGKKVKAGTNKVFHSSGVVIEEWMQGGMPYQEWLDDPGAINRLGNELREYTCPFMRYQDIAGNVPIRLWEKCRSQKLWGLHISKCQHFCDKSECWKQLDREVEEKGYGDNLYEAEKKDGHKKTG